MIFTKKVDGEELALIETASPAFWQGYSVEQEIAPNKNECSIID
ncbi:hypothetical protein H4V97_000427 [Flavobacterium sp. CG_23.5]|nr:MULTISPECIES: hypothetical protein [unclassified Flavobacterium]MBG6111322.1 hypothetical protein [Flavobacterium sp. CG_9.10]MBP2282109.1 hypothetical protein [Flavobacterium sp. CG_23.5]